MQKPLSPEAIVTLISKTPYFHINMKKVVEFKVFHVKFNRFLHPKEHA